MGLKLKTILNGDRSNLSLSEVLNESLQWLNKAQKTDASDLFANVMDMKTGNTYKIFSNQSKEKYKLSKNVFPELDFQNIAIKDDVQKQIETNVNNKVKSMEQQIKNIETSNSNTVVDPLDDLVFDFNYGRRTRFASWEPLYELTPRSELGKKPEDFEDTYGYRYRKLHEDKVFVSFNERNKITREAVYNTGYATTYMVRSFRATESEINAIFYRMNKHIEDWLKEDYKRKMAKGLL